MKVGLKKTRVPGLPVDENGVILGLLVLTHYQRVTDGQTDGHDTYSQVAL